jgi:serine/threonine protein kinase
MKVINFRKVADDVKVRTMKEIETMRALSHPYIIKIKDAYSVNTDKHIIIMSFAESILII